MFNSNALLQSELPTELFDMAWTKPLFTRGKVDAAGDILITLPPLVSPDLEEALLVINNWRSSHSCPLQSFKMTLRTRAKAIDSKAVIAQRLKRLTSIEVKLKNNPNMKLSQMQDIGGCRAVVQSVSHVLRLVAVYEASRAKNPHVRPEFVKKYDYIRQPKKDGYRSIHLVYKYRSDSKEHQDYTGLRVEIQLRSRLQHAWATAVETVSTFTGQQLKSNIGDDSWKRFFALMGSVIAMREKQPTVPGTPSNKADLVDELRTLSQQLKIESILQGWSSAVKILPQRTKDAYAFLLVLDPTENTISVSGFRKNEMPKASEAYLLVEKETADKPHIQAVLVSVNSMRALRGAFPNYYLDTTAFLAALQQAIA